MKKFLFLCLFYPILSIGQTDTTTYIYGELFAISRSWDSVNDLFNVDVYFDFGNGIIYGPEKPITTTDGLTHTFHSTSKALTFLAGDHWTLVSSIYYYLAFKPVYHHYLKRPKFGTKSTLVLPIVLK